MGLATRRLADDERVVFCVRPHWRSLLLPVFGLVAVAAVTGFLGGRMGLWLSDQPDAAMIARIAVVLVGSTVAFFISIRPIARWMTSSLIATDRRLIVRAGVLTRAGRDVPLVKINEVSFVQSMLDRMFGCGTLVVQSASEAGVLTIRRVPQIQDVHREINTLVDINSPRAWYVASQHHGQR